MNAKEYNEAVKRIQNWSSEHDSGFCQDCFVKLEQNESKFCGSCIDTIIREERTQ